MAPQPGDLNAVTQAALDAVRPLAATRNVHLGFAADPGARTISGDAVRLQQVLWNLLSNAIEFTPAGGRVDVVIECSNDYLEIRVVDTGQGITVALLPHVFALFRQADDATTQRHTGLGLGLGMARQLVESSTGELSTPTVPASIAVQRSPFACRLQPAALASSFRRSDPLRRRHDGVRVTLPDDGSSADQHVAECAALGAARQRLAGGLGELSPCRPDSSAHSLWTQDN